MKKFLILDGNSIVNRAFYGVRPLSTKAGLPTNAVFGFLNIIKRHLDTLKPDYIACAFDVPKPTFRHEAYAEYKGTRKGMPEELRAQMPYAKRAVEALGFLVIECPGFEADDVIGTSAKMAEERGIEAYILTGDRDSLQLISPTTTVILTRNKEDVYFDEHLFRAEYGISPKQFIDVKALMGDSSDNIPGVPGIGEKTALKLIQTAGDLDSLYGDDTYFGQSQSVIRKLDAGRESAYLSRSLATIMRDAPICCCADSLFTEREMDAEAFDQLCRELEFTGMSRRFGGHHAAETEPETVTTEVRRVERLGILPAGEYAFYWNGEEAAVCTEDDVILCEKPTEEDLRAFLAANTIVCHDLKGLMRALTLSSEKVHCDYDTMLAAYLLQPGKGRYLLPDTAFEYLEITPGNAGAFARAVFLLWKKTRELLEEYGMLSLMSDIEIPLAGVLAEMEQQGFAIDPDGIRHYAEELLVQENVLADAIWFQAGKQFNINSPKQLGEVLFEDLGLPSGKKTKTGYSTDAETLEGLRPYHSIISDILLYRQTAKLRGTYGESLAAQADEKGRIHTNLNQTGTATGRLASSEPNLQNIPVRMEMGRELRKYFRAADGYVLVDADYSQIELRLLAVLAEDEAMSRAFRNGEDIHTSVAAQVFGVSEDDVTPELRRRAKAVNFGIVYGIGEFSLSKDLGITRRQAKEYIDNYLATYSGVDRYLKKTVAEAKETGYTTTMFGRRRNIPELAAPNRNVKAFGERVAMNSPIQGTAADVIKIAMIRVSRALKNEGIDARLIMQVHDELIVEAAVDCADRAAEILVEEMENAVRLSVPLIADCGMGKTWYEAK